MNDNVNTLVSHVFQSQVKGVVLLEQTPASSQYLVEVQERLTIELGLTCIPVKSPAHAAKILKTMVSYLASYGTYACICM